MPIVADVDAGDADQRPGAVHHTDRIDALRLIGANPDPDALPATVDIGSPPRGLRTASVPPRRVRSRGDG